ncbi:hypothetical protein PSTT_05060 [Puccinia striiformis]|uniref:Uncharacterized protein n=1 Tax=Puccinia striiformis TaxID=27350 RepID=A0A2S4VQH8_9BASI|nr:hypothetical protein PSTT_05060 [Puccinia striiformis]
MFEYGQIKSGSRSPSRGVNPVPFYYPALGCHRAIQLFHHRSGSTQTIFKIRLLVSIETELIDQSNTFDLLDRTIARSRDT